MVSWKFRKSKNETKQEKRAFAKEEDLNDLVSHDGESLSAQELTTLQGTTEAILYGSNGTNVNSYYKFMGKNPLHGNLSDAQSEEVLLKSVEDSKLRRGSKSLSNLLNGEADKAEVKKDDKKVRRKSIFGLFKKESDKNVKGESDTGNRDKSSGVEKTDTLEAGRGKNEVDKESLEELTKETGPKKDEKNLDEGKLKVEKLKDEKLEDEKLDKELKDKLYGKEQGNKVVQDEKDQSSKDPVLPYIVSPAHEKPSLEQLLTHEKPHDNAETENLFARHLAKKEENELKRRTKSSPSLSPKLPDSFNFQPPLTPNQDKTVEVSSPQSVLSNRRNSLIFERNVQEPPNSSFSRRNSISLHNKSTTSLSNHSPQKTRPSRTSTMNLMGSHNNLNSISPRSRANSDINFYSPPGIKNIPSHVKLEDYVPPVLDSATLSESDQKFSDLSTSSSELYLPLRRPSLIETSLSNYLDKHTNKNTSTNSLSGSTSLLGSGNISRRSSVGTNGNPFDITGAPPLPHINMISSLRKDSANSSPLISPTSPVEKSPLERTSPLESSKLDFNSFMDLLKNEEQDDRFHDASETVSPESNKQAA